MIAKSEKFIAKGLIESVKAANASASYPSYYRNRLRYESPMYKTMKRLRNIWSEVTFAVLKREHNLMKMKKRGLLRAKEECLLSALALNLKRMINALERLT